TLARVMGAAAGGRRSRNAPASGDAASEPVSRPAPSGAPVRILVAEDNLVNQKVIVLQLRQLGYEAMVTSTGVEALDALKSRPYELILMDAQMPEMDGIEATRRIRAAERGDGARRPARIIAMTASAMECDRTACLAAGMDDFLPKPVRPFALRAMLERHLTREAGAPVLATAG
ncbi:MAG: response regulator, partial [Opitutaceae bacterium]